MFQQRTWILQRANIEILRECQRSISDQFSEKLSLTQKDLIEKIFYFSKQSDHQPFHEAVERLKHSLIEAAFDFSQLPDYDGNQAVTAASQSEGDSVASTDTQEVTSSEIAKKRLRMYRGRQTVVETSEKAFDKPAKDLKSVTDTLLDEPAKPASKAKRIYRGREI